MEMFVQASSRSVGVRLNRAAQEIGIAIRPSAGRPPFSATDAASWTAGADRNIDSVIYHSYTQMAATLLIQDGVIAHIGP